MEAGTRTTTARSCTIDADLCTAPEMLARIVTGCYLMGYDVVRVTSERELKPEQLEEIQSTTKRLLGLEVVEQTLRRAVIQSFVDPVRFPVEGLIRRLHVMVTAMLNASMAAILEGRVTLVTEVQRMEREVDELYWLILRIIFTALQDRDVSSRLGITNPLDAVGDRMVAKALEEIADFIEGVAAEAPPLQGLSDERIFKVLSKFAERIQTVLGKTMKAFSAGDISLANSVLETVKQVQAERRALVEDIATLPSQDSLAPALRAIVGGLGQIARYCEIIAEVTINRFLIRSSEICTIERPLPPGQPNKIL